MRVLESAYMILFVVTQSFHYDRTSALILWVPRLQTHDVLGLADQRLYLPLILHDPLFFFLQTQHYYNGPVLVIFFNCVNDTTQCKKCKQALQVFYCSVGLLGMFYHNLNVLQRKVFSSDLRMKKVFPLHHILTLNSRTAQFCGGYITTGSVTSRALTISVRFSSGVFVSKMNFLRMLSSSFCSLLYVSVASLKYCKTQTRQSS